MSFRDKFDKHLEKIALIQGSLMVLGSAYLINAENMLSQGLFKILKPSHSFTGVAVFGLIGFYLLSYGFYNTIKQREAE